MKIKIIFLKLNRSLIQILVKFSYYNTRFLYIAVNIRNYIRIIFFPSTFSNYFPHKTSIIIIMSMVMIVLIFPAILRIYHKVRLVHIIKPNFFITASIRRIAIAIRYMLRTCNFIF